MFLRDSRAFPTIERSSRLATHGRDLRSWSRWLLQLGCWAVVAARVLFAPPGRSLADQEPFDGANQRKAAAATKTPTTDKDADRRRLYERHALTHRGDAAAGQQIFERNEIAKCSVCHQVHGRGGKVGPDLSAIGGKFDRGHLVESLLEPSRQIVEGFRTTVLTTVDGRAFAGIVRNENDQSLELANTNGELILLTRDEIDERRVSEISLMPLGLEVQLSLDQFVDVIAYLESLREGGAGTPGEGLAGPIQLPPGFTVDVIVKGLSGATALETLPDGRLLVCEQMGSVRVVENDQLLAEPFVTLPVDSTWERGVIGVTVDPDFANRPHVFVCWVAKEPYPHHRVSRFTMTGNRALSESERVLLVGDDQRALGGSVPAGHQGGALHFGADGKLHIAIGDQTAGLPAQRLDTLQGKLLRIDADGSIPLDNPFASEAKDKYRAIWATGLRNPFTFAVHPESGALFINDVGGNFEEINVGRAGANYGWPTAEHGPTNDARFQGPFHWYPQASIAGGAFVPADADWPAELAGRYLFADFVQGWIKAIDPTNRADCRDFCRGLRRPVDLRFASDGSLYVLVRNAWVVDDKFQPGAGSLLRIRYRP